MIKEWRKHLWKQKVILILMVPLLFIPVVMMPVNAQNPGDYIVTEYDTDILSRVTPSGVRTPIFTFASGTGPLGVAIVPSPPRPLSKVDVPILTPFGLLILIGLVSLVAVGTLTRKNQ